ncbi:Ig-like domain repeat protein [Streptomyces sp. SD15]
MRTLPIATAFAVVFSSAALAIGTVTTAAADSTKILPVMATGDLVVDGVHQHVFVSDPRNGKIVVTNYSGTVVKQVTSLPGVTGLALSADSGTLYAAARDDDSIVAIDTATLTESARYPTGTDTEPEYLAVAGGKIWFGYGTTDNGNIGSLDTTGADPVVTLDQDAASDWRDAPRLAATPGAPNALAAGDPYTSSSLLAVYDVAAGTAARTAFIDHNHGQTSDLAFTPDGSKVITANGDDRDWVWQTSDLAAAGSLPTEHYANAAAVAPDGTVAAGSDSSYDPDVHVFTPGATTPVRQYDFPNTGQSSGSDLLADGALAWQPGGTGRLFAVSSNSEGVYSLRVLDAPTKSKPTLTVTAPGSATRAKSLTVSGTLTGTLPLPAGTPLTVTRTDLESPKGKSLGTRALGSGGTFSFKDTPPAGGKVTYKVSYAGDATHTSASGAWTVDVSRASTALTLNNNRKVYAYGADVKFTAHLGSTYKNRSVQIYADPYGGDKPNKLVKAGTVNSSGNLSVWLDLKRDAKITAKFTGDSRYKPKTVSVTVGARVKVSTAISGQYTKKSVYGQTYYYFHKSKDPLFTTTMTAYPNRQQRLQMEVYYQGTWYDAGSDYFKLNSAGVSKVQLGGTHETGYRMRVRSSYYNNTSGDTVNSTTHGAWKYFIFTS